MDNAIGIFYDRVSLVYPAINVFLKAQRKVLIEAANRAAPGSLLEVGVGQGTHLPLYKGHQVTGIDVSAEMLHKAQRYQAGHIHLQLMDGEDLQFPEASFDYVVLSHVIAVAQDPEQLLAQVYKVLKPGGQLFILNHFTPGNWLRYVDRAFQPLSSFFHFRSSFHLHSLNGLQAFSLLQQTALGFGSYYTFLIYRKP